MEKRKFYQFEAADGAKVYAPVGSVKAVITDMKVLDNRGNPVLGQKVHLIIGDGYQVTVKYSTAFGMLKELSNGIQET